MFCPVCGAGNDERATYCVRCGARLDAAGAPGMAPNLADRAYAGSLPIERAPLYAGFWKRFAALIIDWLILSLVFFVIGLALGVRWTSDDGTVFSEERTGVAVSLAQLVIPWLYWAVMESSSKQATLGKLVLGIRVVDLHGRRISFLRATGRFFGKFVSSFILCIGYLMAAFTARKQALHDLMAGCLVVNRGFEAVDGMGMGTAAGTMPARRGIGTVAMVVIGVVLLVLVIGALAGIGVPAYRDYQVRAKVKQVAAVATDATRAINDYYERTRSLPDDLAATRFAQTSPAVGAIAFDKSTRTLTVTANFDPLEGRTLTYVASSPTDAPRIVWRCTSDDIPSRYLPQNCRTEVTRL